MVEWFRALDLKSGGPLFKSSTLLLSGFVLGSRVLAKWAFKHPVDGHFLKNIVSYVAS